MSVWKKLKDLLLGGPVPPNLTYPAVADYEASLDRAEADLRKSQCRAEVHDALTNAYEGGYSAVADETLEFLVGDLQEKALCDTKYSDSEVRPHVAEWLDITRKAEKNGKTRPE